MVKVNMSAYGTAIHNAILDPVQGLYTNNGSAPLQAEAGMRQTYKFGLYSYCAFVQDGTGLCGNHTMGEQFRPFDTISADMLGNYSVFSAAFLQNVTFHDSKYLGQLSKTAYWMFFLGTFCVALAFLTGILKATVMFFSSFIFSVFGSVLLLIGASIWTVTIKKSQSINTTRLGITVSAGSGLYIAWAAFICFVVSTVPYGIASSTFRG